MNSHPFKLNDILKTKGVLTPHRYRVIKVSKHTVTLSLLGDPNRIYPTKAELMEIGDEPTFHIEEDVTAWTPQAAAQIAIERIKLRFGLK